MCRSNYLLSIIVLAALLGVAVPGPVRAAEPDDVYWAAGFNLPGPVGNIEAQVVFDNKLIVAGEISSVDADSAHNVAMFNGVSWAPFPTGFDDGIVYALCVYNGALIAGGTFRNSDGHYLGGVASWDGAQWQSIGAGDVDVYSLAVFSGKLAVGGTFTTIGGISASRVATWDGLAWGALGTGLRHHATVGEVQGLTEFDGELVAAGLFDRSGTDVLTENVARWNGVKWESLGDGHPGILYDVIDFNGQLVVTGANDSMVVATFVAETWVPMGNPLWGFGYGGEDLEIIGGELYAAGIFQDALLNPTWTSGVIHLNGSTWEPVGDALDHTKSLVEYNGRLFTDQAWLGSLALDGATWVRTGMGNGVDARVTSLCEFNGGVVASGAFQSAGTTRVPQLASFDGVSWAKLSEGMPWSTAEDMIVFDGQLVACGYAGPTSGRGSVAFWDGGAWQAMDNTFHGYGRVLRIYHDELYVAGYFQWHNGAPLGFMVAKWTGSSWQSLTTATSEQAYAMTVYDDKLIVGGRFNWVGSLQANLIAAWDGVGWSTLGTGIDSAGYTSVTELCIFNGRLMAGGKFTRAGGEVCHNFAAWDGMFWTPVPVSNYSEFGRTEVYGNLLIVAGEKFDGRQFNKIGAWDGHDWSMLGSGVTFNGSVKAILSMGSYLMVGGEFGRAGERFCGNISEWTKPPESWFVGLVTEDGRAANPKIVTDAPVMAWSPNVHLAQTGYELEVGSDDDWAVAEMWATGAVSSNDTSVTYAGLPLAAGVRYHLRIRVDDGAQWSPWHYTTFRTNGAPSTPVQLSPVDLALTVSMPTLWVENAIDLEHDVLTYEYQGFHDTDCVAGPGIGLTGIAEGTDSTGGVITTPLAENCRYWWSVRAFDGHLYSSPSGWQQFVVNGVNEPPSAISGLSPAEGNGEISYEMKPTFAWTSSYDPDPGDTVRYRLEVAVDSSFAVKKTYDSLLVTSFTVADSLAFGTHYWWRVTAFDKTGLSVQTPVRNFRTWQLGDIDYSHGTDIGDLTAFIDNLFLSFTPILPLKLADLTGDCNVDIGDLTALINNLFITFEPLKAGCE